MGVRINKPLGLLAPRGARQKKSKYLSKTRFNTNRVKQLAVRFPET